MLIIANVNSPLPGASDRDLETRTVLVFAPHCDWRVALNRAAHRRPDTESLRQD